MHLRIFLFITVIQDQVQKSESRLCVTVKGINARSLPPIAIRSRPKSVTGQSAKGIEPLTIHPAFCIYPFLGTLRTVTTPS